MDFIFDGQREDEDVVALWRQHIWVLSRPALIVILIILIGSLPLAAWHPSWALKFLLLSIAIAGLYFLNALYVWYHTLYILTSERVFAIYQSSLLTRSNNEVPLGNIQNVSHLKRGLWAMLFDFGNIEIQTSGSKTAMEIRNIENPYRAQQRILAGEKKGGSS